MKSRIMKESLILCFGVFFLLYFTTGCATNGDSGTQGFLSPDNSTGGGTVTGKVLVPINASNSSITKSKDWKAAVGFFPTVPQPGVKVICEKTGEVTSTDSNGEFTMSNVPTGEQSFTFSGAGLETQTVQADVQANTTTQVNSQGSTTVSMATNPSKKVKWTIMVYIAGDNDLDTRIKANLEEMEKVGSSEDVNMIVIVDKKGENTKLYYMIKDLISPDVTSPYADIGVNLDTGDIKTLEKFVEICTTYCPADHYLLDIWDHGSGFKNATIKEIKEKGICHDEVTDHTLSIIDIKNSLTKIKDKIGKKLDIITCDACLMACLEVIYEWRDLCDFFVGSEEIVPDGGFAYDTAFAPVVLNPDLSSMDFAKALVISYAYCYSNPNNGTNRETLSAIQMSKVYDFKCKFNDYCYKLYSLPDSKKKDILDNAYLNGSIRFDVVNANSEKDYLDINNFVVHEGFLCNKGYADPEAIAVANALVPTGDDKVVVANYCGPIYQMLHGTLTGGISIWGPGETIPSDSIYNKLQLSKDCNWDDFINWINK